MPKLGDLRSLFYKLEEFGFTRVFTQVYKKVYRKFFINSLIFNKKIFYFIYLQKIQKYLLLKH